MPEQDKQVIGGHAQVEVQGIGLELPARQPVPGKVALELLDAVLRVMLSST